MFARRPPRLRRIALLAAPIIALAAAITIDTGGSAHAQAGREARPTIVLVHGDWADASSWNSEIRSLQGRGYKVVAPPNPLRGPLEDAAYLRSYLQTISGPIVLVAHSYGGFVITNAATGNPNIKALVYIDSFIPERGDTLLALTSTWHSCVDQSALTPVPSAGAVDLYLRWEPNPPYPGYRKCFANGVGATKAAILFATQRPGAAAEFTEPSGSPAWRSIPSWSLIGTRDHVIPRPLQEFMSSRAGAHVTHVVAGHLSLITQPRVVTGVILAAVHATR